MVSKVPGSLDNQVSYLRGSFWGGVNVVLMEWISVKDRLPQFGVTVLWYTRLKWMSGERSVQVFSDKLSDNVEILEYGEWAYNLDSKPDYLAYDGDYHDEVATHWMPISPPQDQPPLKE